MNENRDINKEIVIRYIADNYTKLGESSKIEYVTSADIARELQEMADIPVASISDFMFSSGFELKFIDGKPHWELYTK